MARAGYCSECQSNVWLTPGGGCVHGHLPTSISNAYDAEPEPSANTAPTTPGLLRRAGSAITSRGKEMTPAEVELKQAEIQYNQSVKFAQKNLRAVTKQWDATFKEALSSRAKAESFGTAKIGSYGGVTVWEHAVQTPHGTINLELEPATASVDNAGSLMETRRSTLTRMATGGLLLGPLGVLAGGMVKKKGQLDTRELYLVIESASVASIVPCNPDAGAHVRQLAVAINNAARGAPLRAAQRQQSVAQWNQHIASLSRQRDASIREAQAQLESAQRDTSRIVAARAVVDSQSTSQS